MTSASIDPDSSMPKMTFGLASTEALSGNSATLVACDAVVAIKAPRAASETMKLVAIFMG